MHKDPLTTEEWVKFLSYQADHTQEERHSLYRRVDITSRTHILDIGCGTGAILADIASLTTGNITGIDINRDRLGHARIAAPSDRITFVEANAMDLPFKDETFDLVLFSVVLMYVPDKQKAVHEMARVTQKGGVVLATMEPDHLGSMHYPENETYTFFLKDLDDMGADLRTGRKLRYLFSTAGLTPEVGIFTHDFNLMNGDTGEQVQEFLNRFWTTEKQLRKNGWTDDQVEEYKRERIALIEKRLCFTFLPVFYAIGKK